jgi:hypothetical protein
MNRATKQMLTLKKTQQNSPVFKWLKQDGGQKCSYSLVTRLKWDYAIAMNQASEYVTICIPDFNL